MAELKRINMQTLW